MRDQQNSMKKAGLTIETREKLIDTAAIRNGYRLKKTLGDASF